MTLTVLMPATGLAEHAARTSHPLDTLVKAWLAGQRSPNTRAAYAIAVRQWFDWCGDNDVDPLNCLRAHVELYQRWLEVDDRKGKGVRKPRTIYARLNAMASFYAYLVDELVLERSPMRGVKRPRIERRSPTDWLSRSQMADLVTASIEHPRTTPSSHALVLLMLFNGMRIGEICSLDIASLVWEQDSPVVHFIRKGAKDGRAVLTRPTEKAVEKAIGDRTSGPMLLNTYGNRMSQKNAQHILDRLVPHLRGFTGRLTPHVGRHSWTTACVNVGVPIDQIQHDGGWSDPRLIPYYSHGRDRPERAATHAATAWVMGAA